MSSPRFDVSLWARRGLLGFPWLVLSAWLATALPSQSKVTPASQQGMLGEVRLWTADFTPRGWMPCEGQLLRIPEYQGLFSIIGTTYGGDGRNTFALPDLRGRMGVGSHDQPGYALGARGGQETLSLRTEHLPAHAHSTQLSLLAFSDPQGQKVGRDYPRLEGMSHFPLTKRLGSLHQGSLTVELDTVGGAFPLRLGGPYTTTRYIICVRGEFPSRS